jgi:hypothetical protein
LGDHASGKRHGLLAVGGQKDAAPGVYQHRPKQAAHEAVIFGDDDDGGERLKMYWLLR